MAFDLFDLAALGLRLLLPEKTSNFQPLDTEKMNAFVGAASPDELVYLSAYIRHKLRGNSPPTRLDLEERMKEMDAGSKVSLAKAWQLHEALQKQRF